MLRRLLVAAFALALVAGPARSTPVAPVTSPVKHIASPSMGASYLHTLGPRATDTLAPNTGLIGALVALPPGGRAEDLGLDAVAPGIGRMRASAARIDAFATAHPGLHIEMAPPLHPLMDKVGQWVRSFNARQTRGADGSGVMVGVADTGLDVVHDEMRDENGKSRVAWMLDLSLVPIGLHKDLEEKFGIKDDSGKLIAGAVFAREDIDSLLDDIGSGSCDVTDTGKKCAPSDEIGHGTHVTGIAAASGLEKGKPSKYPGIAPKADIVFVRVTRGKSEGIENDDLVRAVQFMFDRSDAEKRPLVANMSLGSDFGPHDGTFLWEQVIASYVGPDHPGHAVVAAAGNSGSILETPIHQSVRVTKGSTMKVPIRTFGADSGSVQVWVTLRAGADVSIGLDGPDGEWIAPVAQGDQAGKNTDQYNAGVIYGSQLDGSPIPPSSHGGVVVWTGAWPEGTYAITFEGEGMAELYLQGLGDASLGGEKPAFFANAVREGTINLPATHPAIIGVGCTVNRPRWRSISGADVGIPVPLLDEAGGLALPRTKLPDGSDAPTHRDLVDGEVCWFSSSGPTATGVPKPEIAAPGAIVASALSRTALPGVPGSVFTSPHCPVTPRGDQDKRCLQVDDTHAIAVGTSMSSPVVAGVVALLLQQDPTLTQDKVLALLQGGAHHFRGASPFFDQSGPGEVDAMGALEALDRMKDPRLQLPSAARSWITLSADYVAADGSTPLTAIVELRTDDAEHQADFFDAKRLSAHLSVDGRPVDTQPEIQRRGPGVWFYVWNPPPGLGGSRATFGALFDGDPIVSPRTIPIAADRWNAAYPSNAKGSGCAAAPAPSGAAGFVALIAFAALFAARKRRS